MRRLWRLSAASAGLLGLLSQSAPAPGQGFEFTRDQLEHRFGTDPSRPHYPERAVDTDDVPNIVVSADAGPDDPLHYYRIAPDSYLFFGNVAEVDENNRGWNGNAGFVVTSEGVVVIDALGTPKLGRRMIATIRRVTDQPIRYLIITHNHPDHAYGAIAFKRLGGVRIIGHEGMIEYIRSGVMDRSVAYRTTFIAADMKGFEPVEPDILIGGERFTSRRFQVGDRTFEVYNTGHHHSHGDLVVHQVEDGIVWISDLAFNQRVTFMADGSSAQAVEGQTWLLEHFADAKLMVPGHGSAQGPPFRMVHRTRDYMDRLREAMGRAVDEGVDLYEAVETTDFEDWREVRLYELNHKPNVNFVYREMELELF